LEFGRGNGEGGSRRKKGSKLKAQSKNGMYFFYRQPRAQRSSNNTDFTQACFERKCINQAKEYLNDQAAGNR
jgi:hypothetical protein